jgi:polyferredoxin
MADKAKSKGRAQRLRAWVQAGFFILIALIVTTSGLAEEGVDLPVSASASIHAICPFGGVVSFWQLATLGTLVKKVHDSSVILAVIGILLAVLAGPVICGWVCPLGTFQEWVGKLGRRIFGKRYNGFVPGKVDKVLRYLRYLALAWVSYMTIITGKLAFEAVDPYAALFGFWRSEVAVGGLIVLGVAILLSLFIERPFCKYACPYGAFQGIFNLFRIFGIKRNAATCISCNACSRACPMNIEVAKAGTVRDHQCITCMKCTSEAACPVPATVELAAGAYPAPDSGPAKAGEEASK